MAKAIAMLSVVFGHVLLFVLYGSKHLHSSLLMSFVNSYQLPLFFFVAGIVSITSIEWTQIPSDIYKRFRQLIVPALSIGLFNIYLSGHTAVEYIFDFWKWGYWYLYVQFELYIISYAFALLEVIGKKKSIDVVLVVLIPIWIYVYRHLYLIPTMIDDLFCISHLIQFLPFFLLGNYIKRRSLHNVFFSGVRSCLFVFIAFIVSSVLLYGFGQFIADYSKNDEGFLLHLYQVFWDCISLVSKFFLIIFIVAFCKVVLQKRNYHILICIGQNTLYIYVFHYFILQWGGQLRLTEWYYVYGNLLLDILVGVIITFAAVLFSLTVKQLLVRVPILMKLLFYKTI